MSFIFLDSCIVIDHINGKYKLDQLALSSACFSSIVDMEVLAGVKNKRDLHTTNKILTHFTSIDTTQEILSLARDLMEMYVLSHNMTIYDSIIAATCLIYDLPLLTHNKKDFRFIDDLKLV